MHALLIPLLWFCVLGCLLLGGVYFAFSVFVMKALREAGHAGTVVMNTINRVILRSAFMPLFLGTTLASGALAVMGLLRLREAADLCLVAGGVLYVAGMFGVTLFCNVPLNNALQAVTTESRTGTAIWNDYLRRWTLWNHVRTVACVGATVLFLLALLQMGPSLTRAG